MFLLVYSHVERQLAEKVQQALIDAGQSVSLAPIGDEIGSEEWKAKIRALTLQSVGIIAIYTTLSWNDEWVGWRIKLARECKRQVIPLIISEPGGQQLQMQALSFSVNKDDDFIELARNFNHTFPPRTYFVSYSRDDSPQVAKICDQLKSNGIDVWRDTDDIPAGASWDDSIALALKDCTAVLLMATEKSVKSHSVNDEIGYALDRGKSVVPVILEECDLPLRAHRAQSIAIDSGKDFVGSIKELVNRLRVRV